MKNVYAAILAACLGALGSLTVQAQTNTAYGTGALPSSTSGGRNAAFGYDTLNVDTTGNSNTATGYIALFSNTQGTLNTATGASALADNTTGDYNTATGGSALFDNTTGAYNTATGLAALFSNSTGFYNSATGYEALYANSTGSENTAIGAYALYYSSTGSSNTAIGYDALYNNYYGTGNIAIGFNSGVDISESSNNSIEIGNRGVGTDNGTIRIGTANTQTSFYAAGVSGVQISDGVPVYINSNGQLGTVNSSIRFKEDVHDMADASDKLFQLRPVTYRYKQAYQDGSKPVDYGLIAEEVAQVYPDMVARDASGQILTVQYQKLTPMLLNEVQKQHSQLGEQQHTIDMLEQRLSALETAMDSAKSRTQSAAE